MDVKQLYDFVNTATQEALGDSVVVQEDLSNVVDIGTAIFNANAVDRYCKSILNKIGRTIFVNRVYPGGAPAGLLMEKFEFGSVMEKLATDLPEAQENESWNLVDGASYDPNIFKSAKVYAKFYNSKTTFEIQLSFTELQLKQSFTSVEQLNAFTSMLYTSVENSMTIKLDELIMRTINDMSAMTLHAEYGANDYGASSTVKAVNLLYLYNQTVATPLTVAEAMVSPEFIRFASYIINLYASRFKRMSKLFNVGAKERFTPEDRRITVLHADFVAAAKSYLYATTYHDEFARLPDNYSEIAYWQGSGTGYDFDDTSSIDVVTSEGDAVKTSGIIGVMFDHDALGVCNFDRRTTQQYNPKAEFINSWFKADCSYFCDLNENFVVFTVIEPAGA